MASKTKSAFADKKMLGRAVKDSFVKLNPKTQIGNPVMFLVFVSAILTTLLWVVSLFGIKDADASSGYILAIAVILWLFSFSTFLGILFYARSNVAYLFGDSWAAQTIYKILALIMLFVGGLAAYQFVWDLGDVGVGLMTIFNMIALIPLAPKALASLREYEQMISRRKAE